MAPSAAPQLSMRQALAIPAFRQLWLATLVSIFGDFLALYAIFSEMTFRMHASARRFLPAAPGLRRTCVWRIRRPLAPLLQFFHPRAIRGHACYYLDSASFLFSGLM